MAKARVVVGRGFLWFVLCLAVATLGPAAWADGPREGIVVHGAWTVVVKNADGSVASQTRFENALAPGSGDQVLNRLLSRTSAVSSWAIELDGLPPRLCGDVEGHPEACLITEPGTGPTGAFKNLAVSTPSTGSAAGRLVLTGSAKANNPGLTGPTQLRYLTSRVAESCTPVTACPGSASFTQKDLGTTGPTVVAGQTIDVTVEFSFTSAP